MDTLSTNCSAVDQFSDSGGASVFDLAASAFYIINDGVGTIRAVKV
jgi:hypothetical protein